LKDGTISWQGLSSLSQLMMLTVDNNLLTVLPPEIGKLSALKSLNISNNKLTCLPEELGNLLQLEKLDLSHNCLSAVPSNLGRCIQLVEVSKLSCFCDARVLLLQLISPAKMFINLFELQLYRSIAVEL
jgi:Leucine-rich repeat (LRR) protein